MTPWPGKGSTPCTTFPAEKRDASEHSVPLPIAQPPSSPTRDAEAQIAEAPHGGDGESDASSAVSGRASLESNPCPLTPITPCATAR